MPRKFYTSTTSSVNTDYEYIYQRIQFTKSLRRWSERIKRKSIQQMDPITEEVGLLNDFEEDSSED